jgi:hypothetical protein
MRPHSFSKRQLAAIDLILDEEDKNVAQSNKKEAYVGSQVLQKQKNRRRVLYALAE